MRLQLIAVAVLLTATSPARAQHEVTARTSIFHEARGPLSTTAVTPAVSGVAAVGHDLSVRAGWEADVVSAATIAVVDSPADVDAITSATRMSDTRHALKGGLEWAPDRVTLQGGYTFVRENDLRSHGLTLGAAVELPGRATRFDVRYALDRDRVCDRADNEGVAAVDRQRLPNADGCFALAPERAERGRTVHVATVGWTQVLRRDAVARVYLGLQRSSGLLASPYREVWLGTLAAQEHHPGQRRRGALGVEFRWALPVLRGVLAAKVDGTHDDWGVHTVAGQLAWQQRLSPELRLRFRARAFRQSGAFFYSDDYGTQPRGAYFTGDRELSPMSSWLGGVQIAWHPTPAANWLGVLGGIRLVASVDASRATYAAYSLRANPLPDGAWVVATLSLTGELE